MKSESQISGLTLDDWVPFDPTRFHEDIGPRDVVRVRGRSGDEGERYSHIYLGPVIGEQVADGMEEGAFNWVEEYQRFLYTEDGAAYPVVLADGRLDHSTRFVFFYRGKVLQSTERPELKSSLFGGVHFQFDLDSVKEADHVFFPEKATSYEIRAVLWGGPLKPHLSPEEEPWNSSF